MRRIFALVDLLTRTARRRLVWHTLRWGVLAWLWAAVLVQALYVR